MLLAFRINYSPLTVAEFERLERRDLSYYEIILHTATSLLLPAATLSTSSAPISPARGEPADLRTSNIRDGLEPGLQ